MFGTLRDKDSRAQIQKLTGAFVFEKDIQQSSQQGETSLNGAILAVKDNIAVEGMPLSCGSKILSGFISPYSATCIDLLQKAGAVVAGKTNLDEFGMGSSCDSSSLGRTNNPWDLERVAGGSSGGSAAAVAAGLADIALGSDTGGSVRQPAFFCGIYGLKPSYGVISRYGLTSYASSLDTIGIMTRSIDLMESSFDCIAKKDEKDSTSRAIKNEASSDDSFKHRKLAVLHLEKGDISDGASEGYTRLIKLYKNEGFEVETVHLETLDYVLPAYYTIASAEASANLARYTGIRYGLSPDFAENPSDYVSKVRTEGFGSEVKLRILLGTYVLRSGFQDKYYTKAQSIRAEIRRELSGLFENYDGLIMPVFPTLAFLHGDDSMDEYQQRLADKFTCIANLCGVPGLSIPAGSYEGLPTGAQILGPDFSEKRLFSFGRIAEAHFPVETPKIVENIA
jgi:aspartyl-tRNA(Asn)/glutamyl-tRNA(Gln) amidotransferase subunit A